MRRTSALFVFCVAVSVFFYFLPVPVSAATLLFSGPSTVAVGEVFTLRVVVDSEDRGFNAAEASILFPKEALEVVAVDSTPASTVFNFWLFPPSFSNENGTVFFSGGTTRGVLASTAELLSIRMRAKGGGGGEALITANDASINASDGSGTNILKNIQAFRVAISKAKFIATPPDPASEPTTPAPISESEKESAIPADGFEPCSGIFAGCDLRFPTINTVSVLLHKQVGADLFVSGTSADGAQVRLLLHRDNVPYKEIVAIVDDTRVWEGTIANVYAYGTYSLDAWAETKDGIRKSQPNTWDNIDVYPPYTLHPFGFVLRWYAIASGVLGILTGIIGVIFLWRYFVMRTRFRVGTILMFLFGSMVAFVSMVALAYVLWQNEYRSQAPYWKDTDIHCILRAHSWFDVYSSAQLSISVDGKQQSIPAEVGFSPKCVAYIHTHDDTGRLHIHSGHAGRPVTLPDFFTVAGIPILLDGYTLLVTVNGEDYTDKINEYALQDGDNIVVTYSNKSRAR